MESGTYQQLMDQQLEFAALVRQHVQEDADGAEGSKQHTATAAKKQSESKDDAVAGAADQSVKGTTKDADELVGDEDRQGGLIQFATWLYYFKSPGTYLAFVIVLLAYLIEMGASRCLSVCLSPYTDSVFVCLCRRAGCGSVLDLALHAEQRLHHHRCLPGCLCRYAIPHPHPLPSHTICAHCACVCL